MGSLTGSILQGIGKTGNEVATGDIAATNQSHQFMMDYLANQARSRGLDIESARQQSSATLGQSQLDIEKQRLQQSRWQLMPGYSKIPSPDDPSKTQYRHTFMDPITKQQTFYDSDQPPPGSPEYNMQSFKFMRDNAKKELGVDLPINTLLSISGMKVDTPSDINNKYQTYWGQLQDAAKSDPAAKAAMNKSFPGGYVDFFNQIIKGEHVGFSREEWEQYVMGNHLNQQANQQSNPADIAFEKSLSQAQTTYERMFSNADKQVQAFGLMGKTFNPTAYQAAVDARDTALQNLNDAKTKLTDFRSQRTTPPEPGPPVTPPPFANPPVGHPGTMDAARATKLGSTAVAKGSDGNWYYHDAKGNIIGPAPPPGQ